jgi:CRP-like cAMP-binding protein
MSLHDLSRNLLLRALSAEDAALLARHLEPVELSQRFVLERPHEPVAHVYFPQSGLASTVAMAGRVRCAEVGLFGRDGMSGLCVVLDDDRSPDECFMQVTGDGHRIASDRLRAAMGESATMRLAFLRFVKVMLIQSGQTALANAQSLLEGRLCRWLLMCHDRIDGNSFNLTHEFLAMMLGVRRAGVTTAIHLLEGRGLIRASRGCIEILDRDGMKDCAGDIYGPPEAEYERLFGVSLGGVTPGESKS